MTRRFLILPTILLTLAFAFPQAGRADDQPGCDDGSGAWGSLVCQADT